MYLSRGFRRAVYTAAYRAGVHHAARRFNRRRLLVVTYHGLRNRPAPVGTDWSLLPVEQFERQIDYLAQHYCVRPIDDALVAQRSPGGLMEPTACITFDDGYRSNYELALPCLRARGVPATVYLTTGMIGTERLLWTIELDLAFQQTEQVSLDLTPLGEGRVRLTSVPARARTARRVIGRLKRLAPAERAPMIEWLRRELSLLRVEHGGAFDMMSWEEVREMEDSGLVTFGAHTVNHEILSRLSQADLEAEVSDSVAAVGERVWHRSDTFAYPNGTAADFDSRVVEVVQRAVGTGAVSTIEGLNDSATHPYAIRRFNIGSDMEFEEFCLLTSGALRRRAQV